MENANKPQTIRSVACDLMHLNYSQTSEIEKLRQKLICISEKNNNNSDALIVMMMAEIMSGNRTKALDTEALIWQQGAELTDFFQLIYCDNLINLGEIEKIKILLEDKLTKIGDNLKYFYNIFVRFALITGDLTLLHRISEYENLNIKEETLINFAQKNAFTYAAVDYKKIVNIILSNIKNHLCAFDYGIYDNEEIDIVFYTPYQNMKNLSLANAIDEEIEEYLKNDDKLALSGISYRIDNITNHPAWLKS